MFCVNLSRKWPTNSWLHFQVSWNGVTSVIKCSKGYLNLLPCVFPREKENLSSLFPKRHTFSLTPLPVPPPPAYWIAALGCLGTWDELKCLRTALLREVRKDCCI